MRHLAHTLLASACFGLVGCAETSVIGVEPVSGEGDGGTGGLGLNQCPSGQIVCAGAVARTCNGQGDFVEVVDCGAQAKQCAPGYGCVDCIPYTHVSCENGVGKMCNGQGSGVAEFECDAVQGMTCEPNGCSGACSPATLGPSYIGCDYQPTVTWNGVLEQWFSFAAAVANTSDYQANVVVTRGGVEVAT